MAKRAGFEDRQDAKELGRKLPAAAGHNVTEEVFLKAASEMAALAAERKEINERISARRKQFKANGIELGKMDLVLKMAEWDRGEIREHFDTEIRYARWMNLPVGTQPSMFDGMADDEIQAREWFDTGLSHRRAGKVRSLPDHCPEAFIQFYDRGYAGKEFIWTKDGTPPAGKEKGSAPKTKPAAPAKDKKAPDPKHQEQTPPGKPPSDAAGEGDGWPAAASDKAH